MIFFKRILI